MARIATLERFLEQLFERSSSRLLGGRPSLVAMARRAERAMELARHAERGRTVVPARYGLRVHPDDLDDLAIDREALGQAVAVELVAFARRHGYALHERPAVAVIADVSVHPGEAVVELAPDVGRGPADGVGVRRVAPPAELPDATALFPVPVGSGPIARLRVLPGGSDGWAVALGGTSLAIGRARDNGLVLPDPTVSRHHATIAARGHALVFVDLGSRNGSRVNGLPVREVALADGDRIEVGETVLIVEVPAG